jgi:hypothetical protein
VEAAEEDSEPDERAREDSGAPSECDRLDEKAHLWRLLERTVSQMSELEKTVHQVSATG